jgi:hypothetical protein
MDLEGSDRVIIDNPGVFLEEMRKDMKSSIKVACVGVDIRTKYFISNSLEYYC